MGRLSSWLPDVFFGRLVVLCAKHGWNAIDLLAVMLSESGVRADVPNHANPTNGAVGLIQFMPSICLALFGGQPMREADEDDATHAARVHDAEQEARARMLSLGPVEQLAYVERFFAPFARFDLNSPGKFYQATFLPATLRAGDADPDQVVCGANGPYAGAYAANHAYFDPEGAGVITVGGLTRALERAQARSPSLWAELVARAKASGATTPGGFGVASACVVLGLLVGVGALLSHLYDAVKG